MFKDWNENHNWAILFLCILCLIFWFISISNYSHKEAIEHIKRNHCLKPIEGSQSQYWANCSEEIKCQ